MRNRTKLGKIFVSLLVATILTSCQKSSQSNTEPQPPPKRNTQEQSIIYWGVDSADKVDQAFLGCITENFGEPKAFGRYLGSKEGVSAGITTEEAQFLHEKAIKIMVIYNHFTDATKLENGEAEAKAAIALAQELGIPEGVAIFADIEPNYPVDAEFIQEWVHTLQSSPYKPGIYGVFTSDSNNTSAYNKAIETNKSIQNETIIWSSNPVIGVTQKGKAPAYKPNAPETIDVQIWQYGIDGQSCNIDTNLIKSEALEFHWGHGDGSRVP
ncbi:glycoside hydrolase domain-containing protein [Bacillus sp. S/N-304-OC-R1]|uniref:glycoside hydrolase domain-containing protein n=1 Tax=Bacillus sp. S/N-304-OC-R1 TaxID=2758034 RepID=UPI001C8EA9CD|nr:glycoside hydrolase domain-containing protein [Bacillus sp. S/N-304-OC-R1]MBY0124518.1 DUF1906 domain-containing protein [Bacillus sp. S/N-304-OC-R1]